MGRFKLHRDQPGKYTGIIIAPEGENEFDIERTDDGWQAGEQEFTTLVKVREYFREVAGHAGRRGKKADEAEPCEYTGIADDAGSFAEPLPESLSGQLVRGIGRRTVRDIEDIGGGVIAGTVTAGGEQVQVFADGYDLSDTAWVAEQVVYGGEAS